MEPDSSTRSPSRPYELSLYIPTLDFDPTATTNTGMAEGDQVLIVEEEKKEVDISLQQMSFASPEQCKVEKEVKKQVSFFSSSLSSPSSPWQAQQDSRQAGAEEVVKGDSEEVVEAGEMVENGDKVVEEGDNKMVLEGGKERENGAEALGEQGVSGSTEEKDGDENEMTEDKLKSLLEDIHLEEGSEEEEGEEMTEAKVQEILSQVKQAEKDMCSLPGWHSETFSVNVEPPTPGRSVSSDLLDRQENSQENSSDSATSSSRGEPGRSRHNGDHTELPPHDGSLPLSQDSANRRAGHGKEEGVLVSEKKVQQRFSESGIDEEQTVTTRVFRRRVILKGEQAKNIPGESVTEEQFTDEDGNIITRKVIRKVIRRVSMPDDQGGDRGRWDRGDLWPCPFSLEEELEQGDGAKSRRKEERLGEKKLHS
ncbi:unnamed protein product [Oncorhynchus mykiss]|uniref:Uncharacterized protein n=1 Tax=Oncorhynchus mykiss TaxID=8022 RepID=A0A060X1W7_ONCMY|nr:unnamed protein product [Oncorhynchus mykiss]